VRIPAAIASLLLSAVTAATAAAEPVTSERDGVTVDWSTGELSTSAAAVADLHAPTVELARIGAERRARERAVAALLDAARALPVAGGKSLGDAMTKDDALAARVADAVARTRDVAIAYGSDGSTRATVAAPLEGLRAALRGVASGGGPADGPTALVVALGDVDLDAPRLGVTLAAGAERFAGPTVFYRREPPAVAAEPRLGARVVRGTGTRFADGVLTIEGDAAAALPAARAGDALVVLVLGEAAAGKPADAKATKHKPTSKKKGRAR
jgi:hypothetical protein